MNVLLVHNFYQQPGGEDQVFAEEFRLLQDRGHRVAQLTVHNDSIEGMGRITLARKTIWNRDSRQLLHDAIREIDAKIVHFHNTFPLVSPSAYYAAHEAGAAVVQTLHNYRLMCPTATFYRDGAVCEDCLGRAIPWPGVLHKCYRGNRGASAIVAAMLAVHRIRGTWREQVDRYIALTEFSKLKYAQGGLPVERIVVKPNFVAPDPGVGDGGGGFALFVGRLTDEKGIRTLLRAWKHLDDCPSAVLKVLGDGPLRPEVEQAAKDNPRILFEGRRPAQEVYAMMGAARMLMFPSQWFEGLPRTIVESYAKGTPVIASRLGSMTELIRPEKTGLLFEAGNEQQLAGCARRLFADDNFAARLRIEARREYETTYTPDRNYDVLMDCYEQARARTH